MRHIRIIALIMVLMLVTAFIANASAGTHGKAPPTVSTVHQDGDIDCFAGSTAASCATASQTQLLAGVGIYSAANSTADGPRDVIPIFGPTTRSYGDYQNLMTMNGALPNTSDLPADYSATETRRFSNRDTVAACTGSLFALFSTKGDGDHVGDQA